MPKATNDYTAVATAKMRFAEILTDYGRCDDTEQAARVVNLLEIEGVVIELKPRLKAVQITVPIPQPRPASKLGEFVPRPAPEDGYEDDDSVG